MNSIRDNVKDAIVECIETRCYLASNPDRINEDSAEIADAVFGALGVEPKEQDTVGTVVVMAAPEDKKEEEQLLEIAYKCPNCDYEWMEQWSCACDSECLRCGTKNITALSCRECEKVMPYKDSKDYGVPGYLVCEECLVEIEKGRLPREAFKYRTTIKKTDVGFYLQTITQVCTYGQAFTKTGDEEQDVIAGNTDAIMERYLKSYYPIYIKDYEEKQENKACKS